MGNPTLERVNEYQISKASNDDDSNYRKNKVYMDVYHSVCDYDMSLTSSQILLLEDMLSYAIRITMSGYVLKEAIYIGNIVSFIATCGEVNKELVFSANMNANIVSLESVVKSSLLTIKNTVWPFSFKRNSL